MKTILLLYSEFSDHCNKILKFTNTLDIVKICVDNKKIRSKILRSKKFKISVVPSIIIFNNMFDYRVYEGNDAANIINDMYYSKHNYIETPSKKPVIINKTPKPTHKPKIIPEPTITPEVKQTKLEPTITPEVKQTKLEPTITPEVKQTKLEDLILESENENEQPNNNMIQPNNNMIQPNNNMIQPNNNMIQPNNNMIQPNNNMIQPESNKLDLMNIAENMMKQRNI